MIGNPLTRIQVRSITRCLELLHPEFLLPNSPDSPESPAPGSPDAPDFLILIVVG